MEPGARPEPHEIDTINFLAELGRDILILKPSRAKGSRTPDIRMDNRDWEIKSPKGKSSRTIENNFRAAIRQSGFIIFDLRRMQLADEKCLVNLNKEFLPRKAAKTLLVITKDRELLDIKK